MSSPFSFLSYLFCCGFCRSNKPSRSTLCAVSRDGVCSLCLCKLDKWKDRLVDSNNYKEERLRWFNFIKESQGFIIYNGKALDVSDEVSAMSAKHFISNDLRFLKIREQKVVDETNALISKHNKSLVVLHARKCIGFGLKGTCSDFNDSENGDISH